MRKGLCTFAAALTAGALFMSSDLQAQANSSPYWSTEGNNNVDNASKLGTTNAIPLRLFTNDQLRAYISTSGNFGIGTSTPSQRFHVEGTLNQAIFVSTTAPGATSGSGMIGSVKALPTGANNRLGYFLAGSRGGAQNGYNAAGMVGYSAGAWTAGSSHPAYLTFETTPSGSTSRVERVRIEAGGNVGIGTNNPSNKLHVIGRGRFSDGVSVEESGVYSVHTTGNGVEGYGEASSYGSGVYGSGYYGVQGSGTGFGVYGSGGTYGTYGTGFYGAWGQSNSSSGYGVVGIGGAYGTYGSGSSYGVYGYSSGGSGSDPFFPSGVYGYNGSTGYGVGGYCESGSGVYGYSANYVGVYGTTANNSSWAGYFNGKVYSSAGYTSSDRKLKEEINDLTSAMDVINQLKPKSYKFKQDGTFKLMNLPTGKHYGFIAQDIEQVLPNLVSEAKFDTRTAQGGVKINPQDKQTSKSEQVASETIDFKAVNYLELIPVMVKAMQEQQAQIENLKNELNNLKKGQGTGASLSNATMSQNSPNPVSSSTSISYTLPNGTRNARMLVTDAMGRTIKSVNLSESGTLQLNTATLSSGVYNYSLVIDNQTISTRKMTVVR